ncbi:MAG: hypothetical protein ACOC59_02620, partial [Bacteroidota bacterium]
MYDVLMNKFKWGNIEDPDVYLNEDNRRMLINFRNQFGRLADALIREGKQDSAVKVMDRCMEKISDENVHYGYFSTSFIRNYYKTGEREKARKHLGILRRNLNQKMEYYVDIGQVAAQFPDDIRRTMVSLKRLSDITESHGDKDLSEEILTDFDQYMKFLQQNQQLINW